MMIEEHPPVEDVSAAQSMPDPSADSARSKGRWRRLVSLPFMALAIVGLTAAGAVGILGVIANLNQQRAYSTDAELTRGRLRRTVSLELPDEFRPECSAEMFGMFGGERTSIWAMYQWHDSDSFVLVARSQKNITKVARPGEPEHESDAVDLIKFVHELLYGRGRIFEPLLFGEPVVLDDRNPDGSLTEPRNRTRPRSQTEADELLRKQRAKVEEIERVKILGKAVNVWFTEATGAVNNEPYWQVVAGIPVPNEDSSGSWGRKQEPDVGSVLFYLQAKKSELSREQIEAIVRSIGEPVADTVPANTVPAK
ncbi:MAG: hypothetical protein AB7O68_13845 [Pirellulales bacterium]